MSARVWKEFHLSDDSFGRLEALMRRQKYPDGTMYRFEPGADVLVTNLGMETLRRLSRMDDIRLPEYVTVPEDDEIVQEVISEWRGGR